MVAGRCGPGRGSCPRSPAGPAGARSAARACGHAGSEPAHLLTVKHAEEAEFRRDDSQLRLTVDRSVRMMAPWGEPRGSGQTARCASAIIGAGFIGDGARPRGRAAPAPASSGSPPRRPSTTEEAAARLGAERGFADAEARLIAPRHRRRAHLHAQPPPRPAGPRRPGGGQARRLREAAGHRASAGRRRCCAAADAGGRGRRRCRSSTASTRWSARHAPGSRPASARSASSTAATCRTGCRPRRTTTGASTAAVGGRRGPSPTSARTGATSSSSSPATASRRCAPSWSPRCPSACRRRRAPRLRAAGDRRRRRAVGRHRGRRPRHVPHRRGA